MPRAARTCAKVSSVLSCRCLPGPSAFAPSPAPGRAIGRPRDRRADRAIVTAALELMAERGVRDLRMDDVAERAGRGTKLT